MIKSAVCFWFMLFLWALFAAVCVAGKLTIVAVNPSLNTDGTSLPEKEITGTRINYGINALSGVLDVPKIPNTVTLNGAPAWVYTFADVPAGHYLVTLQTKTATDLSNPTTVSATDVPPEWSTAETIVYKQTQAINGYVLKPIGTIELRSPCIAGHVVDGFNLLPDRTRVHYPPKAIMPTSVFAKCALQ